LVALLKLLVDHIGSLYTTIGFHEILDHLAPDKPIQIHLSNGRWAVHFPPRETSEVGLFVLAQPDIKILSTLTAQFSENTQSIPRKNLFLEIGKLPEVISFQLGLPQIRWTPKA